MVEGEILTLGISMGVCLGIGIGLGYYVETIMDISPFGILAGIAIGLGAAFTQSWRTIKKSLDKFEKEKQNTKKTN